MPEEEEKNPKQKGAGAAETGELKMYTNLPTSTRSFWSPWGMLYCGVDENRYAVINPPGHGSRPRSGEGEGRGTEAATTRRAKERVAMTAAVTRRTGTI